MIPKPSGWVKETREFKVQELMQNLGMMFPAMNLNERIQILTMGRASMPPEAFQAVLKIAEHSLNPEDWATLKSKLNL